MFNRRTVAGSHEPETPKPPAKEPPEDPKKDSATTAAERAKDVAARTKDVTNRAKEMAETAREKAERLERTAEERVERTGKKLLDAMQAQPRTTTLVAGGAAFALASAIGAAEVAVAAAGAYAAYRWLRGPRAEVAKHA